VQSVRVVTFYCWAWGIPEGRIGVQWLRVDGFLGVDVVRYVNCIVAWCCCSPGVGMNQIGDRIKIV